MPAYPGGIFGGIAIPQIPGTGAGGTAQTPANVLDATAQMPIGVTFYWNGALYRYVKHSKGTGSVASIVGGPAWASAMTPAASSTAQPIFTVTPDQTDSILEYTPVGVYLAIVATASDTYFICIQIGGLAQCYVPAGVTGDTVIGSATDGQFGRIAAGSSITRTQVGVRTSGASASNLSPVLLMNMDW